MEVQVQEVSSIRKKLSFVVPAERVDAEIAKTYQKLAKTAKVKGFRAGKVPRSVLERYYEPQMQEQVAGRLVNDTWFKALVEHQVAAVAGPEIVDSGEIAQGKPFTYAAEVEIKPELEVKDYTGLKLEKEKFVADAKIIDERLEEMRASRAEMVTSKRKVAKQGDFALIDFEGFLDGVPFDGGKGTDHLLELGSGSFIPGFEEQVVGMKRGEQKDLEVTFPENYGSAELAGKPVVFKVELKEIQEKALPELNEEFAKSFGVDSVDEIRAKLDESYQTQEKNRVENDLRERLMTALIESNPCEVPEAMVASQLEYMLGNVRSRMQQQGMSLEMLGLNEQSFNVMYRDTAVSQVQGSLILEGVARQEKIEIADGDFEAKLEKIAEMSNAPLEAVKRYYGNDEARQGLMSQILEEKTIEFLLDKAKIKEVAKEKLTQKESDKE